MNGPPLADVDVAVRHALEWGDESGLTVLGYGEISLVVGWPSVAPRWACKRLPELASAAAVDRFSQLFERYLAVLASRGIDVVPSVLSWLDGPGGGSIGYVVQPVLDPSTLATAVLAGTDPDPDHPVVDGIVSAVVATVDDTTGLDAQLSNWALTGAGLSYLDVTTPLLFDRQGRLEMDTGIFLAAYPWALRPPIRRFVAPGVANGYRDQRHVLLDLAANLHKERLEQWVPAVLARAERTVGPAIDEAEVEAYYRSDARLWEAMSRLRRADRWWQRNVRRRPYPFLLPGPVSR